MTNRIPAAALGLALAFALGACVPQETPSFREHVLNRIAFGPDAWSKNRMAKLGGAYAYIEEQLNPSSIPDTPVNNMLSAYPALNLSFADRVKLTAGTLAGWPQMSDDELFAELEHAKILRAVYSHRQLQEVLVDFWFNHFNVQVNGGGWAIEASAPYVRKAIRPYVLGNFEDMLVAVAKSPAMLYYLDGWRNLKPKAGSPFTRMNENYGRELLELHTVGVENYTQEDVQEVARCFTGWTIDDTLPNGFYFNADEHDTGSKLVLGQLVVPAGGGVGDGLAVLHFLAHHPDTAQRIARELLVRFVTENPPQSLVDHIAQTFLDSGGDLRAVMHEILVSAAFSDPSNFRTKVKSPFVFAVSAARALGTTSTSVTDGVHALTYWAGEPLFRQAAPTGFPEVSEDWDGVGTLIQRVNFLYETTAQTNGFVFPWPMTDPGDDTLLVNELESWLFMAPLSDATHQAVLHYASIIPYYYVNEKRIGALAYAMLASPEFFMH